MSTLSAQASTSTKPSSLLPIATTNRENITTYQTKRFSTFTKDLRALVLWLSDHQRAVVCMESTGRYWISVYNILESSCKITLTIIQSVPGIREFSALAIFSESGADMSKFHSAKHLCSWAGLAPSNDQSAGKKKSVRISRAGIYIKPARSVCHAAIKDQIFPHYRLRYEPIKHRRGHKKAIIAIARMLLTVIYHMLSTGELFNPSLYEEENANLAL